MKCGSQVGPTSLQIPGSVILLFLILYLHCHIPTCMSEIFRVYFGIKIIPEVVTDLHFQSVICNGDGLLVPVGVLVIYILIVEDETDDEHNCHEGGLGSENLPNHFPLGQLLGGVLAGHLGEEVDQLV